MIRFNSQKTASAAKIQHFLTSVTFIEISISYPTFKLYTNREGNPPINMSTWFMDGTLDPLNCRFYRVLDDSRELQIRHILLYHMLDYNTIKINRIVYNVHKNGYHEIILSVTVPVHLDLHQM